MQMPEATVLLIGNVFRIVPVIDYESKEPAGAKVAILQGEGATEVKFSQKLINELPIVGQSVALMVRPMIWSMEGRSGLAFSFVRSADLGDVDLAHSTIENSKVSAKA